MQGMEGLECDKGGQIDIKEHSLFTQFGDINNHCHYSLFTWNSQFVWKTGVRSSKLRPITDSDSGDPRYLELPGGLNVYRVLEFDVLPYNGDQHYLLSISRAKGPRKIQKMQSTKSVYPRQNIRFL